MFVLQVARLKAPGGIHTAIAHYERMFRNQGIDSAILFRGPASDALAADNIISLPRLGPFTLANARLQRDVRRRSKGKRLVILVHSDRTLARVRALFPEAVIVAPCHSDKTKRKRNADLVLTLNPDQQRLVQAELPRTRVAETGNPFVPAPRAWLPIAAANSAPRFNFIGRFEGFKDPLTLVQAYGQANLGPEIELRLIGAGRLDSAIRDAAASLHRPVDFSGWLDQPFAAFSSQDVLVLPSLWESYSYVIREALDLGVPIIASDIPVHRAALGDGAYGELFPAGDPDALASTLERAVCDVERLQVMSAHGGDAMRARYGAEPFWQTLRKEIEPLFTARMTA